MADKFIEDADERYPDLYLVEIKKEKLKVDNVYLIKSDGDELVGEVVSIDDSSAKKLIRIKLLYKKVGDSWESAVVGHYEAGGAIYSSLEFAVDDGGYKVFDKVPLRDFIGDSANWSTINDIANQLQEHDEHALIPIHNREVRSSDVYLIKTKKKPYTAHRAPNGNYAKDVEYIGFIHSVIQDRAKEAQEKNVTIALLYKKNSYGEWESAVNHYEAGGIYYSFLNFDFEDASVILFELPTPASGGGNRRKQMKRKTRRHRKSHRKASRSRRA